MKKRILYIIFILLVGILLGLAIWRLTDKKDNELTTVKVSEVTHSIFYAPFYAAIENGYFKDKNIDIDLILVSGSDNVAASVLSNDTNVGLAGPESALYVFTGGEKDYLSVFSGLTKRDGQFIVSKDKDFEWKDLKGKEILIGRSTGMPALSFMRALENEGINQKEVKINTSIEFAELSGSFLAGEGDFVNLFEPLASSLEKNKKGYVVKSVGLSSDEFPYTAFYARNSYINDNKELLKNFTLAINEGLNFVLNNEPLVVAKAIQKQFSEQSLEDLEIQISHYKEADVWLKNPYISEELFNTLTELLQENNLLKDNVYYKDLINNLYE